MGLGGQLSLMIQGLALPVHPPRMFLMESPRNQIQGFAVDLNRLLLSTCPLQSRPCALQAGDPEASPGATDTCPPPPRQVSQVGANKTNYSRSHPISN